LQQGSNVVHAGDSTPAKTDGAAPTHESDLLRRVQATFAEGAPTVGRETLYPAIDTMRFIVNSLLETSQ
jgi:hypothetical protein